MPGTGIRSGPKNRPRFGFQMVTVFHKRNFPKVRSETQVSFATEAPGLVHFARMFDTYLAYWKATKWCSASNVINIYGRNFIA